MDLSIFLAKVIGLYMIVVAIVFLKKPGFQAVVLELSKDREMRLVLGLITLILGLMMVVSHNIWYGGSFRILITIIAWITFLKGVLILWMSDEAYENLVAKFKTKSSMMTTSMVLYLVLGIYLTYIGFFV